MATKVRLIPDGYHTVTPELLPSPVLVASLGTMKEILWIVERGEQRPGLLS